MGYPSVSCAQGFYFSVMYAGNEYEQVLNRLIAGGVTAHLIAYTQTHPQALRALLSSTSYPIDLTYQDLAQTTIEFLTEQLRVLYEKNKSLRLNTRHQVSRIILLGFLGENEREDIIHDDDSITVRVELSSVPVALHYGL